MRLRVLLGLLLVLGMAAFTWWVQRLSDALERNDTAAAGNHIDYYLDDFRVLATGNDGRPRYRLEGARMTHLAPADTATIEAPKLEWIPDSGPVVTLRSERAEGSPGGEEILLAGEVTLRRPAWNEQDRIDARTRDLRVWPEQRTAHTPEVATAEVDRYRIRGRGLAIDLNRGTLTLEHEVRGTHVP
ncbi:MAG: LPS export ABC transporter periplasmic protein LptC [Gammaproteobacteria bacterium]|nr:MAG: LPS export ABC transporter periplasmic protein LptC [Gammaproteobacteria bacterium]